MQIQTVKQLNNFVVLSGLSTPEKIISHLAAEKVIVSTKIAKLILERHNSRND